MPNDAHPPFEHEASLEELAGVGKNRRFDKVIDGEEFEELQVVLKRGGEEYPLAKPSRAFYFGDHSLYDQEAKRFDQEEKSSILNTSQFPRNLVRFEELKRSCERGIVIPFVGAGMSKSAGCPEWKEYLLGLCFEARLDTEVMRERLEANSDFEGVMNDLVQALGESRFNLDFERDFKTPDEIQGCVTLLPRLFDRCAITTNFDRVLEKVYEADGRSFINTVTGRGRANAFFRAIPAGERYLLKLHGNLDEAAERVLNKAEYEEAYGNDGNVNMACPLPKLLHRLFTSYSFLFLGCSLSVDRTIQTFMRVAGEVGADSLPHHYAILSCPSDEGCKRALEDRLTSAHITALWYPENEHEHVQQILELLLS